MKVPLTCKKVPIGNHIDISIHEWLKKLHSENGMKIGHIMESALIEYARKRGIDFVR